MPRGRLLLALLCLAAGLGCIDDPVSTGDYNLLEAELELVWNAFDQTYVNFPNTDVDWDQAYSQAKSDLDTVASVVGLAEVLWDMTAKLEDPSVYMEYGPELDGHPYEIEVEPNMDSSLAYEYYDELGVEWVEGQSWGHCLVADSIPLFVFPEWSGFSWGNFDDVLEPLMGCDGMILDIRVNTEPEGNLAMTGLIAKRFTDILRPGYFRMWRNGPGREDFAEPSPYYLHPREGYTGPVLLLVGQQSAGYSERFASMMDVLPHVTLAGDTTRGFTDCSTVYYTGSGEVSVPDTAILRSDTTRIQNVGIPPDIYVHADSEDFATGVDPVLEYALDWAESR